MQIDGCDHDWFEGRGPRCTLLGFVDDATGQLMELRFARTETTFDYFAAADRYLRRHGKPIAFYSDKHSIFRDNKKEAIGAVSFTQFGRAMQDLNIDVICANTAAAKGRVERAHQTLQDRLVKELRLNRIDNREAGNAFIDLFREDYNRRFARVPKDPRDAHRPLAPQDDLARAFTRQEKRRLTNNLALHYNRVLYVVEQTPSSDRARGKRVDVREDPDGTVHIEYRGVELQATAFAKDARVNPGAIVENRLLSHTLRIIESAQQERDENRLANKRMTLRDKDKLRKAMGITAELHARPKRIKKPPTYPPMQLTAALSDSDPLAHVLAWAKTQGPRPKPRELSEDTDGTRFRISRAGEEHKRRVFDARKAVRRALWAQPRSARQTARVRLAFLAAQNETAKSIDRERRDRSAGPSLRDAGSPRGYGRCPPCPRTGSTTHRIERRRNATNAVGHDERKASRDLPAPVPRWSANLGVARAACQRC